MDLNASNLDLPILLEVTKKQTSWEQLIIGENVHMWFYLLNSSHLENTMKENTILMHRESFVMFRGFTQTSTLLISIMCRMCMWEHVCGTCLMLSCLCMQEYWSYFEQC